MNAKADGYRGIWYSIGRSNDEYAYKYSGGMGTYCAKHKPFAVHCPEVGKTFFCYGGTSAGGSLLHMVSFYDHETGTVPRPTVLLDKKTGDAHDNPVISVDARGYVWIFSTSHGIERPSCIHRSKRPYDVDEFEKVPATRSEDGHDVPFDNYSYFQVAHVPGRGFFAFMTHYHDPVLRTIGFITSRDGVRWSEWKRLGAAGQGHYQVGEFADVRAGTAFNCHPQERQPGSDYRTNLYYLQTDDWGQTWTTAAGEEVETPLTRAESRALVRDYQSEGLNVYLKDTCFDEHGRPVILYLTSPGFASGPVNDPRTWTVARWTGADWAFSEVTRSDSNYDMGSIYIHSDAPWQILAPTGPGPQRYNPGGEVVLCESSDRAATWSTQKQLTAGSAMNHNYVRRPVNAHPDFYALWADGHGRRKSESRLYFCDREGVVYRLPQQMGSERIRPERVAAHH